MKTCPIKWSLQLAAFLALATFLGGFLWSLFPVGGHTLPHWVESTIGVPFGWAAVGVSLVLGGFIMFSMSVAYVGQELVECGQETGEDDSRSHRTR